MSHDTPAAMSEKQLDSTLLTSPTTVTADRSQQDGAAELRQHQPAAEEQNMNNEQTLPPYESPASHGVLPNPSSMMPPTIPQSDAASEQADATQHQQMTSTMTSSERPLLPPPKRTVPPKPASASQDPAAQKSGMLRRLGDSKWGQRATKVSDALGVRVNGVAEKVGVERFWPTTGDGVEELAKCERVLREFVVSGVPTKEDVVDATGKKQKKTKVLKKIPPSILAKAKGIVIFSAFRSGFAPIGGSGGSGVVMIRKPDGGWSAPAFIAPNNVSGGFLIGLDAFNAIIVLNSDEAVKGFKSHQFTLGAEIGIVAGPLGAGAGVDSGLREGSRGAPIFTYVASKGFYAGVELVGQVFVEREEENEIVYARKGIRSIDILEGRCTPVAEAEPLHQLLREAESGTAQGNQLEKVVSHEENKSVA